MTHDPHSKATFERHRLIARLRASSEQGAAALAAFLDTCTASTPCRSAACPVCALDFQQAAVAVVEEHIQGPARVIRNRMTATTIVPGTGCLAPTELTVEACDRVANQITSAFSALGLPATVIGFEVSFNEDTTGAVEPHWGPHGHSISLDWLSNAQEQAVRATFPRSRLVNRPVKFDRLDRNQRGLRYPFKPEHVRRVTSLKSDHPTRAPYRDTDRRELRSWQAVSLALVEHQRGFGGRLLIHRINERAVREQLEAFGWARTGP